MQASIAALPDGAHVVQFYSEESALVDVVARLVGTALVAGDSAVVIATGGHESALRARLWERGLSTQGARRQKRYLTVDAGDLVSRVGRDNAIDAEAFRGEVGAALSEARAASETGRVVAFGEAVALLVDDGRLAAALDLERRWNELLNAQPFALCCAYPMESFRGSQPAASFLHVCSQHSQVFPAERRRVAPRVRRPATAARR